MCICVKYLCNSHILFCLETGKLVLKPGALPTFPVKSHDTPPCQVTRHTSLSSHTTHLPVKSHDTPPCQVTRHTLPVKSHDTPKPERREIIRHIPEEPVVDDQPHVIYKSYDEFCARLQKLKLGKWALSVSDKCVLSQSSPVFRVPKFDIVINQSLDYVCYVFGWHLLNSEVLRELTLHQATVSILLKEMEALEICEGVNEDLKDSSILHSVPYQIDYESEVPFMSKNYVRPKDCLVLISNQEDICSVCATMNSKHKKNMARKQKHINTPARLNAPLSRTDPNRVALALQEERKRNKKLMERIENELATKSVAVDKDIEADINFIMENTDSGKISDFMQLFWKQQKEAATKKKMMYHPMIIRFCLSLASKSSSAYDELRSVLTLPSRRTLNDYKNVIKPSAGFNPDVIAELTKLAAPLREYQRYICLSFDEMKIKENLVFDKHTEKLVGFVDLGDPDVNFSNFPENVLASHALVFYVRGIASDLKFALAYFATCGINAHQIMSLFWDAVSYLELSCTLPVVACVSDGSFSKQKIL